MRIVVLPRQNLIDRHVSQIDMFAAVNDVVIPPRLVARDEIEQTLGRIFYSFFGLFEIDTADIEILAPVMVRLVYFFLEIIVLVPGGIHAEDRGEEFIQSLIGIILLG